jgi:retinal rod rhodopsin-sensitive cGMP 3',5'-cyclic phosphodiesterase subunit delta
LQQIQFHGQTIEGILYDMGLSIIRIVSIMNRLNLCHGLNTEWRFKFGFVMPDSTNTWENIICADSSGNMLPAAALSGNLTITTFFYDGDQVVKQFVMRVFYE